MNNGDGTSSTGMAIDLNADITGSLDRGRRLDGNQVVECVLAVLTRPGG